MADLEKPITTQEDLDALLDGARAEQSKQYDGWLSPEDVTKKYEGWVSPEDAEALRSQVSDLTDKAAKAGQKYSDLDKAYKEEQAKSHSYEVRLTKLKVAQETGLPAELAGRLSGEKEEDIRKDAKKLKEVIGEKQKAVPPLANFDDKTQKSNSKKAAWDKMLSDLKGE